MNYRSVSFHQAWPDPELVRLAAETGFNDVCFQTERGTLGPLVDLRGRAEEEGYFDLAADLGMTTSLWVHEFEDVVSSWGPIEVDNEHVWNGLRRRYEYVLGELFPELDHLVLTVAETEVWVTDDDAMLRRLVETVREACAANDVTLILRSFVYGPDELAVVRAALEGLPADVWVMTKCVPQDWHYRSVDHPLLGAVGDRTQVAEIDIAGEYHRTDAVANAFTDEIGDRFDRWTDLGVEGVSVRVDRGWVPWQSQATVRGEAQEANLWALGLLSAGEVDDLDEVWARYATHRFGEDVAEAVTAALRPTGEVVEEALCVGRETFADPRQPVPAGRVMEGRTAERLDDEAAEAETGSDPFSMNWSVWRWDDDYVEDYHRTRTGHPDVIAAKERAFEAALDSAAESIEILEGVTDALPEDAGEFFRFKLAENRYNLRVTCEMELAWLEMANALYRCDTDAEEAARRESVSDRLERLEALAAGADETMTCTWLGEEHELTRGSYVDVAEFCAEFRRYWGLD